MKRRIQFHFGVRYGARFGTSVALKLQYRYVKMCLVSVEVNSDICIRHEVIYKHRRLECNSNRLSTNFLP